MRLTLRYRLDSKESWIRVESLGGQLQIWRELAGARHLGRELDTGTGNAGEIGIIACTKAKEFIQALLGGEVRF